MIKPVLYSFVKKILIFSLISLIAFYALAQKPEDIPISGEFVNKPLGDFLVHLQKEYHLKVFYKKSWVDTIRINQRFDKIPLIQAMNRTFRNTNLVFEFFQGNGIMIVPGKLNDRYQSGDYNDMLMVIGDPLNIGRYRTALITGKVVNGKNGEPLVGAVLFCPKIKKGVSADGSGNFEMELPTGEHNLQLSFIGFEQANQKIKLIEPGHVEFELFEKSHSIGEVTVTGQGSNGSLTQMSMVRVDSKLLKELPVLMGEKDVIKSITMMAGVQTVSELASGFNVRGGNTDQNLVLVNGSPVFNTSHLFGFFSMLNPDVVEDVRLYKGGMPAKFGERVSSVMEVDLKEGNDSIVRFYGGIGLLNSRLTFDGPLTKDKKLKILAGARSSYSDWILRQIPDTELAQSVTSFYDLSGKVTYNFNLHNKLSLMGYSSNDEFSTSSESVMKYGNILLNLLLRTGFSEALNGELNLSYSRYKFRLTDLANQKSFESFYLDNQLQYFSGKYHFSWHPHERHLSSFGADVIRYINDPGTVTPAAVVSVIQPQSLEQERLFEMAGYLADEIRLSEKVTVNAGIRYSHFLNQGPKTVFIYDENYAKSQQSIVDSLVFGKNEITKSYGGFEPRASINIDNERGLSFKLSYQRTQQFISQVSNNAVVSPAESWKASDYHLKPLISDQVAAGITHNNLLKGIKLTSEIYYKKLQNLIEYKNGAEIMMNSHLETDLIPSDGYSYGIEISASKSEGRLTGMLNYMFARTKRKTNALLDGEEINRGNWYPSIYDKPHDLSVTATYNITRRWRFSGNFVFISGRPVTLPEVKYQYAGQTLIYYSDRNKYRMPPYHRFDLALTFDENLKRKRMWKGSWTFSVYNVYGRHNPYSVYYRKTVPGKANDFRSYALYQLSVIGIPVPTLTYNFKF